MSALWILLIGVAIVIGGILLLRLHAFVVLILAALVVSALTPRATVQRYAIETEAAARFRSQDEQGPLLSRIANSKEVEAGERFAVIRFNDENATQRIATLQVIQDQESGSRKMAISTEQPLRLIADDIIITPAKVSAAEDFADKTIGERVASGFGSTCGKIGILIAMAAIIGKCLLDSGAADRIVRSALQLFGERGAPGAFLSSGFLLGIPVFFDTVFYLMIPLGKALRMRTGRNYLLYVLTIVAGATMAHSLVPPTPGPLFVAEELGVDLGLMIIFGGVVGLFASATGYLYASFANRRWELPLRESPDFSLAEMEKLAQRDDSELPPLWLSLLPILLPVLLIGGYTVLKQFSDDEHLLATARVLGNKNIALVISAGIAMAMLVWKTRISRRKLAASMQSALASGGVIILITAAGGAFGQAMKQTGVASLIRELPQGSMFLTLLLAFLVTTAIRTAQGSATVAMITAVGILAGIATPEQLGFHPVYLALAIGCGSKPLAWMNDSGFWVICKMSGMTEVEGLKFVTPMSAAMGVVGLAATMLLASLFPLAGG